MFTQNQCEEIAADYAAPMSISALRAKYGAGAKAIRKAILAGGGSVRRVGRDAGRAAKRLSEGQEAEVAKEYQAGATYGELAARWGVSASTARAAVVGRGVERRGRFALAPELAAEAVRRCRSGESAAAVAASLGVGWDAVAGAVRRAGVRLKAKTGRRMSPDAKRRVAEMYAAGGKTSQIAAAVGCSSGGCLGALRQAGVPVRPRRKHFFDEGYFGGDPEALPPPAMRWLGFVAADGCVTESSGASRRPCQIQIALAARDRGHLEAFLEAVRYRGPIDERTVPSTKGTPCHRVYVSLYSPRMAADLVRLNITPRKSMVLVPPTLSDRQARHFFGGMMDGNGIVTNTRGGASWRVGLCGSKATVDAFAAYVERALGWRPAVYADGRVFDCVTASLDRCKQLGQLFYADLEGSVPLERKAGRVRQLLETQGRG